MMKEQYVLDGIVDKAEWGRQKKERGWKILFILKEPNGPQAVRNENGQYDLAASLADRNNDEMTFSVETWKMVDYWAYGLLHTEIIDGKVHQKTFQEAKSAHDNGEISLSKIAVINLSKQISGSKANIPQIIDNLTSDDDTINHNFILKQIKEIEPDIIITGNIFELLEKYVLLPAGEKIEKVVSFSHTERYLDAWIDKKEEWVNIWKHPSEHFGDETLIIRHYHPQASKSSELSLTEELKYNICLNIFKAYIESKKKAKG